MGGIFLFVLLSSLEQVYLDVLFEMLNSDCKFSAENLGAYQSAPQKLKSVEVKTSEFRVTAVILILLSDVSKNDIKRKA